MSPTLLIVIAVLVVLFVFKKSGEVSAAKVSELMGAGAVVVDVRTVGEYQNGHIDGVVNIPMDRFAEDIATVAPDKDTPLLLHCGSGTRSGMVRRTARRMGYTSVHNLGSYSRAQRLVAGTESPGGNDE